MSRFTRIHLDVITDLQELHSNLGQREISSIQL